MNGIIRNFRENDLIPVQELIYRTIDECYTDVYPPLAVQFFKDFHSKKNILDRSRKGTILVVEADGKIVATGSVVNDEIFAVFVSPDQQHKGYGRALMLELEKRAKAGLVKKISLSVSLPSREFYEGLGYSITEDCSLDVGEGQQLKYWTAVKELSEKEENNSK